MYVCCVFCYLWLFIVCHVGYSRGSKVASPLLRTNELLYDDRPPGTSDSRLYKFQLGTPYIYEYMVTPASISTSMPGVTLFIQRGRPNSEAVHLSLRKK